MKGMNPMNASALRRQFELVRGHGKMLNTSSSVLHADLREYGEQWPSADYLVIPPINHTIGKIVVSYVLLNARGVLESTPNPFYAVTARPQAKELNVAAGTRSRETHVLVEDQSMRAGVLNINGRSVAEAVGAKLIPELYRNEYLDEREAHIHALMNEYQTLDMYPSHLKLAINALDNAHYVIEAARHEI